MSAFYIGQRVRIVGAVFSTHLIGSETTITEISVRAFCARDGFFTGHRTAATSASGIPFVGRPAWLEPLLPPGLESLEEINALYEPSEVHA